MTLSIRYRTFLFALLAALFGSTPVALAAPGSKGRWLGSAEPLVNYGVLRNRDGSTNSTPLSYGVHLNFGIRALSFELAGFSTLGEETAYSSNATSTTKVERKSVKGRVGLRGNIPVASFLDVIVRAGIEGQQRTTTTTVTTPTNLVGTETSSGNAMYGYGFLGTGISVRFTEKYALNISGSTTFKDGIAVGRNDYDASIGVQITQVVP